LNIILIKIECEKWVRKMKLSILYGHVFEKIKEIPNDSIDLCITSPPYWGLRDYGVEGQLGAEPSMEKYLDNTLIWVKEVWRVLKPSGSFVLNIGDCFFTKRFEHEYGFYKTKQLLSVSSFTYCKIISETDFVCRGEHIWAKPNMPSPIRSRLKHSHEKLFWFVKDVDKYYFDEKAWLKPVLEGTQKRNMRAKTLTATQGAFSAEYHNEHGIEGRFVAKDKNTIEHSWRVIPVGAKQSGFELHGKQANQHIAPFPENLIEPYIQSLCPANGTILDTFLGSGTTMRLALTNNRNCVGIELNEDYIKYAKKRLNWGVGLNCEYNG
jgi:DNA modification methylase